MKETELCKRVWLTRSPPLVPHNKNLQVKKLYYSSSQSTYHLLAWDSQRLPPWRDCSWRLVASHCHTSTSSQHRHAHTYTPVQAARWSRDARWRHKYYGVPEEIEEGVRGTVEARPSRGQPWWQHHGRQRRCVGTVEGREATSLNCFPTKFIKLLRQVTWITKLLRDK